MSKIWDVHDVHDLRLNLRHMSPWETYVSKIWDVHDFWDVHEKSETYTIFETYASLSRRAASSTQKRRVYTQKRRVYTQKRRVYTQKRRVKDKRHAAEPPAAIFDTWVLGVKNLRRTRRTRLTSQSQKNLRRTRFLRRRRKRPICIKKWFLRRRRKRRRCKAPRRPIKDSPTPITRPTTPIKNWCTQQRPFLYKRPTTGTNKYARKETSKRGK